MLALNKPWWCYHPALAKSACLLSSRTSQCTIAMASASSYGNAGTVMNDLNRLGINRKDMLGTVKQCIDKAVADILPTRATVQSFGSAPKGTSIRTSDWDFFVHLHQHDGTVTKNERLQIRGRLRDYLGHYGIDYVMQLGENRVRLYAGSDAQGPLPDVDVVFERFKHTEKLPPDDTALASSHIVQQVVKYLKHLPFMKTNLPRPRSSLVEQLVMEIHTQLSSTLEADRLMGAAGFDLLLSKTLRVICGSEADVAAYSQTLQNPELNFSTRQWQEAATALLKDRNSDLGWLRPV